MPKRGTKRVKVFIPSKGGGGVFGYIFRPSWSKTTRRRRKSKR